MEKISTDVLDDTNIIFKEMTNKNFLNKMIILFIIYLFSNYIFDRINNEDLKKTFIHKPNIIIQIPNKIIINLLIAIGMIITSHIVYFSFIKQLVYKT